MIKGCNKRVIVMKETGSDMIEEAIFIIRSDADRVYRDNAESDILRQANLILEKDGGDDKHGKGVCVCEKKKTVFWGFVSGLFMGATSASLLFLIL